MKQQFLKDKTGTIRLTVYENNVAIVPTSATIILYTASGGVLQASDTVTVGSDGEMTYTITATHTATLDLNLKAVWAYVVSGSTFYAEQLFDVVRSILSIPITDDDLFNELESLRDVNLIETGTATAGASGTLTDTLRRKEDDDFWTGGKLEILSGTGDKQVRDITDFVQSTSVLSVSPDFTTTPDTTSKYRITRGFTKKIRQAFDKLETMIYNKGERHSLIIESSQVKIPLIYLTVHFISLDLMDQADDKWSRLGLTYWELFQTSFSTMKIDYDRDESGTITGDEEQDSVSSMRILRS